MFAAPTVFAQDETVTVRVDGRSLFRVGGAGSTTAANRAAQIERRLNSLLEKPEAIAPAQIGAQGEERVVNVAGVTVVTVTAADAQENLTTADALAAQWATSVNNALERGRSRRLSSGGRFLNEIQASVETAFSRLLESAITIVPRFLAAVLVLGLFWLIAAGVRWLMRVIFRRIVEDLTVESLIKQVAYYAVWALGLLVAADALGFDPQTVVTGLGLTGLALGFALKDIISNFVSGILILVLRPFELGDQIVVGETEGSVER
nr:mechanosensitive ion channel family protein [Acidobacteriota bacterium]